MAEGPFFTGSTLKLDAYRGFSPDFHFIRTLAGPHKLDVRGIDRFCLDADLTYHLPSSVVVCVYEPLTVGVH